MSPWSIKMESIKMGFANTQWVNKTTASHHNLSFAKHGEPTSQSHPLQGKEPGPSSSTVSLFLQTKACPLACPHKVHRVFPQWVRMSLLWHQEVTKYAHEITCL